MQAIVKTKLIQHSLFWWMLGNLVGVLLSLLVVLPELNQFIAPVTYGRLIPLHLNFHLYGWSALPMIALLYLWYQPTKNLSLASIWLWSVSLAVGGLSWCLGSSSGKLFLEWQGFSKNLFIINLIFLWLVLVIGYLKQKKKIELIEFVKIFFLVCLGLIPFVMNFALRQDVFPPINTQSSGATGASLLISSLGVVGVFLLAPLVLMIQTQKKYLRYFIFLALHILCWLLFLSHGHSSQYDLSQVVGLSSMLIWIPLLILYFRKFDWPKSPWLISFALWGSLLVIDAAITFLPGVLELAKFTNLLVAHVHIAMAGMTTSFAMIVLLCLNSNAGFLNNKYYFNLWNLGLLVHLLSLFVIGFNEAGDSYYLFSANSSLMLAIRMFSGVLMFIASLRMFFWSLKENEV